MSKRLYEPMTEEQQTTFDEYENRLDQVDKTLKRMMWELIRCSPQEEAERLITLRQQSYTKEAIETEQREWHKTRPLKPAPDIAIEQGASPDDMAAPDGVDPATWAKMVEKSGYAGAWRTCSNNKKMKLLGSLAHLSYDDLLALVSLDSAQAEVARAQIKLAEYERLAIEGKKDRIVKIALSNADLQKEFEPRLKAKVNDQRRSSGNVIRVESGDGR